MNPLRRPRDHFPLAPRFCNAIVSSNVAFAQTDNQFTEDGVSRAASAPYEEFANYESARSPKPKRASTRTNPSVAPSQVPWRTWGPGSSPGARKRISTST